MALSKRPRVRGPGGSGQEPSWGLLRGETGSDRELVAKGDPSSAPGKTGFHQDYMSMGDLEFQKGRHLNRSL